MSIVSLRQLLATELGVISTQITKADKAEHIKRKRHVAPQTALSSKNGFNGEKWNYDVSIHKVRSLDQYSRCILSSSVTWNYIYIYFFSDLGARPRTVAQGFLGTSTGAEDSRVARMVQQVKEVLPDVPLSVITRDLCMSSFHNALQYAVSRYHDIPLKY